MRQQQASGVAMSSRHTWRWALHSQSLLSWGTDTLAYTIVCDTQLGRGRTEEANTHDAGHGVLSWADS